MLVAFIFIISYSMYMHFLVLEIKPSQSYNLILATNKLTIMTGNNVHFLILKVTKKLANLWWLNLGTESDLSSAWISYCVRHIFKHFVGFEYTSIWGILGVFTFFFINKTRNFGIWGIFLRFQGIFIRKTEILQFGDFFSEINF